MPVFVGVVGEHLEFVWWWTIPKMSFVEIFSNCGVRDAASFVRFPQREAGSSPLIQQPFLQLQSIQTSLERILDAHFGHYWEAPNLRRVDIPGNVSLALIPHVGIDVAKTILLQNRMQGGPANFRVPKP